MAQDACPLSKLINHGCSSPGLWVSLYQPNQCIKGLNSRYRRTEATDYAKVGADLFKQCGEAETLPTSLTQTLPVLVCGYNEDAADFVHTLQSVAAQQSSLRPYGLSVKVLIVLDGWDRVSKSMRQFCYDAFPFEVHGNWAADLEGNATQDGGCSAVLLQTFLGDLRANHGEEETTLDVSVMIKSFNRKKHDSILAFLRGFVPTGSAEFAVMTDSGTCFGSDCFAKQIGSLNASPLCAGVTGHQRIRQSAPQNNHSQTATAALLHGFQTLEKELDFTGWHFISHFGFLPILHGQCNVWRMASLTKAVSVEQYLGMSVLDIFEREMHSLRDTSSLFGANLFLVEDRLLSLLAVMLSGDLKFVPDARFYYQPETTLASLFSQRRRWNNGTAVAQIETIRLLYRFWSSRNLAFKLAAGAHSVAQFSSDFVWGCIAPAVQFHTVIACIEFLGTLQQMSTSVITLDHEAIAEVSVVTGLLALIIASYLSGGGVSGLLIIVTAVSLAASIGCVVFIFMGLVGCLASCSISLSSSGILMAIAFINTLNYLSFLAHSLMHRDLESIKIVFTHLPACLFWQAYGWFTALHASLLHAISWGNRPDQTIARNWMRCKSAVIATLIFMINAFAILFRKHTAQLLAYMYVIAVGPMVLMKLTSLPLSILARKDTSSSF